MATKRKYNRGYLAISIHNNPVLLIYNLMIYKNYGNNNNYIVDLKQSDNRVISHLNGFFVKILKTNYWNKYPKIASLLTELTI